MSLVFVLVAVVLAVAAGWLAVARLAGDGGPRRPVAPRVGDHWSTDLPDRPYACGGLAR